MLDFACGGEGGEEGEERGRGKKTGGNYELLCRNHYLHYVMTNVIKCKARLYSRIVHIIPKSF